MKAFESKDFTPQQLRNYINACECRRDLLCADTVDNEADYSPQRTTPHYSFPYILPQLQAWGVDLEEETAKGMMFFNKGTEEQKRHIRQSHNLEPEEYFEMFKEQNFACAVCMAGVYPYHNGVVDHCKRTNTNCAILCDDDNKFAVPIYEHGNGLRGEKLNGLDLV